MSKDKFSDSDYNCELVGFRCLEEFGSKKSCSRAHDFTPENWIIGYRFSLWKYVDILWDIRIFNLVAGIQRFIREEHQ